MKDKLILFTIGVLVGAVISTGAFYIYTITNNNCCSNNTQMNGETPPEMPNGQNNQNGQNGNPPEKPNDSNTQNNNYQ